MKLITSGLSGTIIDVVSLDPDGSESVVLLKRDDPAFDNRPYSTHVVQSRPDVPPVAFWGHYDLILEDARADLAERTGR